MPVPNFCPEFPFTGQLVPQDPDDEPAGELLARIRAEREATPEAKSRRKASA